MDWVLPCLWGGESTPSRALIQSGGYVYRLPGQKFKDEFNRHTEMLMLLLRYTQSLITQMAQTAVCNRHHPIDQQLCRWLLSSLDRLPEAAGKLQKLGAIEYARGKITILNRPLLERLSCECYAVVKKETDRLMLLAHHQQ